MIHAFDTIMRSTGRVVDRTPERAARAFAQLTEGYSQDLPEIVGKAVFTHNIGSSDWVEVRGILFYSLCEHHILPFFGSVDIRYKPNGRILGLSKFSRIVTKFSRMLQVQERMTSDIFEAIVKILHPSSLRVITRARHMCMEMRGLGAAGLETVVEREQMGYLKLRGIKKTTDCPQPLEAYPLPGENIPYPNKTNIGGPDGN